jgi:hypothetical protein
MQIFLRKHPRELLYEKLIKRRESLKELQDLGVVSPTVLRDLEIYEEFHRYPELCKECRYDVLAEHYGFKDNSSIRKIIEKLSK